MQWETAHVDDAVVLVDSTFRSMRHRNFRLFVVGQFTSQVGNWLTLVAQSLFVIHLGGKGIDVGILAACQFLPVLIFGAYGGVIADRMDKRRLLLIVQSFAMAQSFALAYVASRPQPSLLALDAVAAIGGLTMAFDNPARRSFAIELVSADDVRNAVALNSSMMTSSRIVGPLIAGLLINGAGYAWCFAFDGITYIAVLVALLMMRTSEMRRPEVVERQKGQVREGFAYVRRSPELWVSLLMMAVVGTLSFNFQVVLPLFVKHTFHESASVFTYLFAVLSAGSLAGALYSARRTTVGVRDVAVAALAFGAALMLLSAAPNVVVAFPLSVAVGWASILFLTSSTAIVQIRCEPSMRGRVLALQAIVFLGSTPVGGPIVGAVSDWLGARAGLVLGGLAAICAGAYGLLRAANLEANPLP